MDTGTTLTRDAGAKPHSTFAHPAGERPLKAAETLDYHALNAMLNLYDDEGRIQLDKDRMAAKQYFLQHVNQNTVFFHNLRKSSITS